jgi:hypothetical protein
MRSRNNIAREVDSFPDIACLPFETERRLLGMASWLLGVETHFGAFLLPIDGQNLGIEIEAHGGDGSGFSRR